MIGGNPAFIGKKARMARMGEEGRVVVMAALPDAPYYRQLCKSLKMPRNSRPEDVVEALKKKPIFAKLRARSQTNSHGEIIPICEIENFYPGDTGVPGFD